jgi:hypothetical protein
MHKGEVVEHSNFTRNITKLEQFCSLKLFWGMTAKKKAWSGFHSQSFLF